MMRHSKNNLPPASSRRIPMLLVVGGGLILLGLSLNHILSMATTTNNNNNNNNINKAQQRQQPSPAGFQFEVWGKVQGVFFRKYTKQKADEYGVVGWIRNHKGRGTVQGEVVSQDVASKNQMKVWLQSVGSPMSVIEKANFEPINDEHHITELVSKGTFDIRSSARRFLTKQQLQKNPNHNSSSPQPSHSLTNRAL